MSESTHKRKLQHRDTDEKQQKLLAAALTRLSSLRRAECIDPNNLDSRPTEVQKQVIEDFGRVKHQYIRAGTQSGKSSVCSRIITWAISNSLPNWTRPAEPMLILVAGRTGKQIEHSLVPRILSFLEPGTYKQVVIGNILQHLEFTNGDRIVFQSLENPVMARERLQSYTAHIAWLDELPPTLDIISELQARVQAKSGQFLASFTPLTPSYEIQQYIDSAEVRQPDYARVYRFSMLDNPIYSDEKRRNELLASMENIPEKVRRARLYGDWMSGDESVYEITGNTIKRLPEHYSKTQWRHVLSIDPAMSSDTGVTIWAEDPRTIEGHWYCVLAEYVPPLRDPIQLVHHIAKLASNYNVVRRITDPHGGGNWFTPIAWRELRQSYTSVDHKSGRKEELIANLQVALGTRIYLVQGYCGDLIKELQNCRYSDRADGKLVNSQSYHLIDSSQYFVDSIPRSTTPVSKGLMGDGIQASNYEDWLYKADRKRREEDSSRQKQLANVRMRVSKSRIWR